MRTFLKYQALKIAAAVVVLASCLGAQTPIIGNLIQVAPNSTNTTNGALDFIDVSGFKVGFQAPALSANTRWMLPAADAVGCLQSNGSLVLSFTSCGAASVSNGFIVSGKTTVAPPNTSMGLQVWYDPTLFTTNLLSYDNAAALSSIKLSASTFDITAVNTSISGNFIPTGLGTQAVASKTLPFGSGYFLTNVSSQKVEVYDVGSTDLNGASWHLESNVIAGLNVVLHFKDNAGVDMLTLSRIHTGTNHEGILDADWGPSTDNTYDLGYGLFRWRNINAAGAVSVGSLTCTGSPCGAGNVANGFFVTNNTVVSPTPTARGMQSSFIPSGDIGYIAVYDGSNNLSQLRLGSSSIQLVGTPTITAVGTGPFILNGSGSGNGNILLNPTSAGTNGSVVIQAAINTQPGLIIDNAAGSSTGNSIFEIRDSTGLSTNVVFKVITSGDPNPNSLVSWSHFPHNTSATDTLGDSAHRWGKLWVQDIDYSGTDIWLRLVGGTMSGNINANAVNTLSLGSKTVPFGSGLFMTNVSSQKVEVYDVGSANLNGASWHLEANVVAGLNVVLHFKDNVGNDMLSLNRIRTGLNATATLDGTWLPATNNSYDIGFGTLLWRNLNIAGAASVGSITCTGSPCGTPVVNGFFVTNNTAVAPTPTSVGLQLSYIPSSLGDIKVYDAANNLATLRFSASVIQLGGTPTITAVGSGPLILNASGSGNGNIVLNPTNTGSNASVVINTPSNSLPGLIINNAAGSSTGNSVLEIRDSSSAVVLKVVTSGDPSPNTLVTWSHFPHNTAGTDSLGDSAHRWIMFANTLNVSGITTVSGNINSTTVGTLSLGSTTNPFGSTFALTNVSSKRLQVYDAGTTDLTGASWSLQANATGISSRLTFVDTVGGTMMSLNRLFTGFNNTGILDGSWLPAVDATYDLGLAGSRWRNANLSGSVSVGSLTCTGSPCGSAGSSVANGFFVTNNTAVTPTPTAPGLQFSYLPNSLGDIKSYDGSGNPTALRLTASVIQLLGTPTITTVATGPLTINGSGSTNGNILFNPGAIGGNASVRMFQATNQPVLKLINLASLPVSTMFEIDASNQTSALFWVEAAGNLTTSTGCANCVHSATMFPTSDGLYDVGGNALRWNTFRGFAAQLGLVPFSTPIGVLQVSQTGQSLVVVDAYGNGGLGIPSFVGRSANGTTTSPTSTLNGDVLFSLTGRGFVSGGFTSSGSAAISMLSNENWGGGGGGQGADIYMQTTQAGFSTASRATRAIFTGTGMNPASNNTGSLGVSGDVWNALWVTDITSSGSINMSGISVLKVGGITAIDSGRNGFFSAITVGSCSGCSGGSAPGFIGTNTGLNKTFSNSSGTFAVNGNGDLAATTVNAVNSLSFGFGAIIFPPNGASALNGLSICSAGQHVNAIAFSQGLATGFSCN